MHTTVLQLELEKSFCIVESTFKSFFFCRNTSDSRNYGCEKLWQDYRDWEDSDDVAQDWNSAMSLPEVGKIALILI